ncbi:cysteine synthase A [Clostridium sp. AM58-1XD]|uniref:cysteine synthase A n=1 Tax=Clostridium sp. AM58-1XD TaxID=2292307 RepID=UPI000E5228DB|nr:cysteine synthase A [Clostridium sp. AM58-1XD]RGY97799.1 cysteine synthase A [Clostridium sp. AM58-1XD]
MENIRKSAMELIGNTPLLELCNYERLHGLKCRIAAKLDGFNPAGSAKDRAALFMIEDAEKSGRLKPGATIIEPTSGNTGIGLASIAAMKGYKVLLTMPDTMSQERRDLLKAYGAEIVLTDGKEGMGGAVKKAEELKKTIPGSVIMGQFDNPANANAHRETTGPELWRDTDGQIAAFVAGIGSGGTITGTGEYLKGKNSEIKIFAVEPASSPYLSQGKSGAHGLQGIGAGFIPSVLNTDIYDEIITVTEEDAYRTGKEIAACEGILVGITSAAAVWAAGELAKRPEFEGKLIAVFLPDTGDRYLSTPLFR